MRVVETDVLVVGAGPSGLTAAAFLAMHGVDAVTVTKYPRTANTPRAHITNQRTMEVMRDLGIEDQVRSVSVPNELMADNVWATSMAGKEIARVKTWGTKVDRKADYEAGSPSAMCNMPQHLFEPLILQGALDRGADIRFSTELTEISQDADGVTATVRYSHTGETYQVRAKYAIGADGGRSTVAEQLGFSLEGETGLGYAVNIWLEADLSKYRAHRPGVLFWTAQPGKDFWLGSGVFITVRPWNEWVLVFMYDPDTEEIDTSEEAMLPRIYKAIGDDSIPVTIKNVSTWQVNHVLASEYQRGRVFLAGDAAHRHPPANGLGSNTSIQDAYNLAWKLAAVVKGQAGPSLLESYHQERHSVGRQVVDRALKSADIVGRVPSILGIRPGQTDEEGWAAIDEFVADTDDGRKRRKALEDCIDENAYHFHAHGVELGHRYTSTAVVGDGTPFPAHTRDPELYYQPTTHPGAYMPHVWIERNGEQISTLDAVGHGRFTVITGIGGEAWVAAAEKIGAEVGVEIASAPIGYRLAFDDVYGDWARAREISDGGCLLVRPDRHIAWRSHGMADDPLSALREAIDAVLSRV
ncbi:2,4-dichlorophenol 6-monooxygenase [Gordonia sihwensis]|uniref:FAD-dependent monooxygenase n=1 Tax=Gordonia sihwensis TaxID=173559 RepID=UPI001C92D51F|nr:FAD-dependent monooxygenase [Gordonia sihwensis]MBY4571748.1 2,4-dichlorophenol 6-monooxygenase [Gordonia sihwensis]